MVLERYRARVGPYLDRMSRPFLGWRPESLSYLALALMIAAAVVAFLVRFTTPLLFLAVSLLIFLSGVFDVLDGAVARATGRAGPKGDFLDHVLDRYADLAIVVGVAASAFALPVVALLALVSLLMTSYMGTQAQAVGLGREYGGLLTRADRLLLFAGAAFVEFDLALPWPWAPTAPWVRFHVAGVTFTVWDVAFAYVIVAGQLTAFLRARSAYRRLSNAP